MRRKSLNKKSLKQGGATNKQPVAEQPQANPRYADLIPDIKSAIRMGASVKELLFELIQQNIPDEDIAGALKESGISELEIQEAQDEIQQEAMMQMQQQMQQQAAMRQQSEAQDPNLPQAQPGTETSSDPPEKKSSIIDLMKDYNVDPNSKEGYELAKTLTLEAIESGNDVPMFSCRGGGCAAIASNAAREYGVYNQRANAWDLGNKNYPQWISSNYADSLKQKQLAQKWLAANKNADKNSKRYKEFVEMANQPLHHVRPITYNLDEFIENVEAGNLVGLDRANTKSSVEYANNRIYPNNRGYEHSGFMMDDTYMIHGSKHDHGPNSPYKGIYTIDDITDGISLPGYGNYSPVETIGTKAVEDVWGQVKENDTLNKLVRFFEDGFDPIRMIPNPFQFSTRPFRFGFSTGGDTDPDTDPPGGSTTDATFESKADHDARMLKEITERNEAAKSQYDIDKQKYDQYLLDKKAFDEGTASYQSDLTAYEAQKKNPVMYPTKFGRIGQSSGLDSEFKDTSKYTPLGPEDLAKYNELQKRTALKNNARYSGTEGYTDEVFIPRKAVYLSNENYDQFVKSGSGHHVTGRFGELFEDVQKPVAPIAPTEVVQPTEPTYEDTSAYQNIEPTKLDLISPGLLSNDTKMPEIRERDEVEGVDYEVKKGPYIQPGLGGNSFGRFGSGYYRGPKLKFGEYRAPIEKEGLGEDYGNAMAQSMLKRFTGSSSDNLVQNQYGNGEEYEMKPGAVSDNTRVTPNPYLHFGSSEPIDKLNKNNFLSDIIKRMTEPEVETKKVSRPTFSPTDTYVSEGVTMMPMKKGGSSPPKQYSKEYYKNLARLLQKEDAHPYMLVIGNKELGIPKMAQSVDSLLSVISSVPDEYYDDPSFFNVVGDEFMLILNGNQYSNIKDEYYAMYGDEEEMQEAEENLNEQYLGNVGRTQEEEDAYQAEYMAKLEKESQKRQQERDREYTAADAQREFQRRQDNTVGSILGEIADQTKESAIHTAKNIIPDTFKAAGNVLSKGYDAAVSADQWLQKNFREPYIEPIMDPIDQAVSDAYSATLGPYLDPVLNQAGQLVGQGLDYVVPVIGDAAFSLGDALHDQYRQLPYDVNQLLSYTGATDSDTYDVDDISFGEAFADAERRGIDEFRWVDKDGNYTYHPVIRAGEAPKGEYEASTKKALDAMRKVILDQYGQEAVDRFNEVYAKSGSPNISFGRPSFGSMHSQFLADATQGKLGSDYGGKADVDVSGNIDKLNKYLKPGFDPEDSSTWQIKDEYKNIPIESTSARNFYAENRPSIVDGKLFESRSGRPMYDGLSNVMFLDEDFLNSNPEVLTRAYIAELAHAQQRVDQGAAGLTARTIGYQPQSGQHSILKSDAAGQNKKEILDWMNKNMTGNAFTRGIRDYVADNIANSTDIYGKSSKDKGYGLYHKSTDDLNKQSLKTGRIPTEYAHAYFENPTLEYILGLKDDEGNLLQSEYNPQTGGYDLEFESMGGEPTELQFGGGLVGNISNLPGGTYGAVYRNPRSSYLPMDLGMQGSGANILADIIQGVPKLFSGKDRDGDGAMDGLLRDRKLKRDRKRDLKALEYDYYLEDKLRNRPNQDLSGYSAQDLYEGIRRGTGMDDVRTSEELEADLRKFSRVDFDPESGGYEMIISDRDPSERLSRNRKVRDAYMEKYSNMDSSMGEFLQRFEDNPEAKAKFLEMFRARKDGSTFGFSPDQGKAFTYEKGETNPYLYNTMMGYNMYNPNWDEIKHEAIELGDEKEIIENPIMDPILSNFITPFSFRDGGGLPKAQGLGEWMTGQMVQQSQYEQNQLDRQKFQEGINQYFQSFDQMGIPDGTVEFPTDPGTVAPSDLQLMGVQADIERRMMSDMQEGKASMLRNDQPESDFELKKKRKKGVLKEKLGRAKDKFADLSTKAIGFAENLNSMFADQRGRYAANNTMLENTSASAQGMQFQGPLSRGRNDLLTGNEAKIMMGIGPSGYDDGSQFNTKEGGEILDLSPSMIAKLISAGADIEKQ